MEPSSPSSANITGSAGKKPWLFFKYEKIALIVVIILFVAAGIYLLARSNASSGPPEILSAIKGQLGASYCVASPDGTSAGDPIYVGICNGSSSEDWKFYGSLLKLAGTYCMEPNKASTANGASIVLATCVAGDTHEQWDTIAGDGLRNVASGDCLDMPNGRVSVQLEQAVCNTGEPQQKWTQATYSVPAPKPIASTGTGQIFSTVDKSLCLAQVGSNADLETCSSSTSQQWDFSNASSFSSSDPNDYQIQNVGSGDYLDVNGMTSTGDFSSSGTDAVTVSASPADLDSTHWELASNGVLRNWGAGNLNNAQCLADPANAQTPSQPAKTVAGEQLIIWTCNGAQGEEWTLPVSTSTNSGSAGTVGTEGTEGTEGSNGAGVVQGSSGTGNQGSNGGGSGTSTTNSEQNDISYLISLLKGSIQCSKLTSTYAIQVCDQDTGQ